MRTLGAVTLALVALAAVQGCKQKEPEPIPAPKAVIHGLIGHTHSAGIAWFQGSLDEAFAAPDSHATCAAERAPMTPLAPDLSHLTRKRLNTSSPNACRIGTCPATAPRHPLV
jgi:hypothetical protein